MSDESVDPDPSEGPTNADPGSDDPDSIRDVVDEVLDRAREAIPGGEQARYAYVDSLDRATREDMREDVVQLSQRAPGCLGGCLWPILVLVGLVMVGVGMFLAIQSGWFGFGGSRDSGSSSSEGAAATSIGGSQANDPFQQNGVDWVPRDGTWEIENLPFLPQCGPGSLGSGFQQGTIEVIDEGAWIVASGSQPGSVSIELGLVDAGPGRLVYFGVEPMTGLEMEMVFTSPTQMTATVRNGDQTCVERPATGAWDREIGDPDPDAAEDEAMPEWMPESFPVSGGAERATIEGPTSKTVTIVVEDTPPGALLFSIAEWAVDEGHPILERGSTTLTIQTGLNQLMYVEVVDIGNFNTQLTVTIEET